MKSQGHTQYIIVKPNGYCTNYLDCDRGRYKKL